MNNVLVPLDAAIHHDEPRAHHHFALPLEHVPRGIVARDTRGIVKIVVERSTRKIVGATVVADGAGDVILAGVYAVQFGLTLDQVTHTWAPYLTMAEGFKLAAQTFDAEVAYLSCCAA